MYFMQNGIDPPQKKAYTWGLQKIVENACYEKSMHEFYVLHSKTTCVNGSWKNGKIIHALGKMYGDNAPRKLAVRKLITNFKNECNDAEDDAHSGRLFLP